MWKTFGDEAAQLKYEGEIKNGEPEGLGVSSFHGTTFIGKWKEGKKHGQGTFTYGRGKWEGEKYVGEFKYGYRNGQGTYTWSDGRKYEGEFEDGIKHGQGTWTSINGDKYVGEWRENKSWNGKEYDKKGNIIGKYVNGVKIIEEPVVVVKKKPMVVVEKRQTGGLFRRWENRQWRWFRNGNKKNWLD